MPLLCSMYVSDSELEVELPWRLQTGVSVHFGSEVEMTGQLEAEVDAHLSTEVGLPGLLEAGVGVQIDMPSERFATGHRPLSQIRYQALRHPTFRHYVRKTSTSSTSVTTGFLTAWSCPACGSVS